MQYTESQLTKLIEDVEKEFTAHLAKAEASVEGDDSSLSKSEDGDEKKPEQKKPEEKEGEHKPEQKPEEGAEPKTHEEPKEEQHPEAVQAAPGHDYDQEDLEHLQKMYMSMSEGERKVHHDAIMKCAGGMAKCGDMSQPSSPMGKSEIEKENKLSPKPTVKGDSLTNDKQNGAIDAGESEHERRNGGKIEGDEPGKTPGAKSPASKADGVQMEKSEQNVESELLKSELASVNGKYEELKKNFDAVAAFLTKLVDKKSAPAAKAITSLDAITKGEGGQEEEKTLTKSEIEATLLRKSQDPSTSKADREAINAYYLSGEGVKSISHLLK